MTMGKRDQGAPGPLVVSRSNPRSFTIGSGDYAGHAVYLAGSHIWNSFHDGMGPGAERSGGPERFDFDGYLDAVGPTRFTSPAGEPSVLILRSA